MSNTLSVRSVDQSEWSIMREQSSILVKTGFLPTSIKTPEQAVAIMLKGRELGIPTMYALSNIAVIQGKPVAGAELLLALVYRDHGDNAIRFKQTDNKVCTIEYRRRSWQQPERYSYSIEDAKTAGLLGNQTWQKYPQAMLRARCISSVARMAFADTIGGMYTPEELGAAVTVNYEGVVELDGSQVDTATGEVIDAPEPEPLRAQPPVHRVLTKPPIARVLDRQAAIQKITMMWAKERQFALERGTPIPEQQAEQDIPIEDETAFTDADLVQLGITIKARLQEAAANAELVEPEAVEA